LFSYLATSNISSNTCAPSNGILEKKEEEKEIKRALFVEILGRERRD